MGKKVSTQYHADFLKGEIPTCKAEIDLKYIYEFCKQDKEKAGWFVKTMEKYNGEKARHLKVRRDFVDKFYPSFNEKPKRAANSQKALSTAERYLQDMMVYLEDFKEETGKT